MDPEIRIVRIAEALGRYGSGALSCLEAAEVLGMSERHFRLNPLGAPARG